MIELLRTHRPDEVYNLAAQCFVQTSFSQPVLTGEVTGLGVTRLLDAIRLVDPDIRFYQASLVEMFGKVVEVPQTEDDALLPPLALRRGQGLRPLDHGQLPRGYDLHASQRHPVQPRVAPPRPRVRDPQDHQHRRPDQARPGRPSCASGNLDAQRDWGFAGDYVEAMWLMLQQDEPDDYVVATGETHSVREFCEVAFGHVGLDWEDHVVIDERFFRPAEVDLLVGDAGQGPGRRSAGRPTVGFADLVTMMVDADMDAARRASSAAASAEPTHGARRDLGHGARRRVARPGSCAGLVQVVDPADVTAVVNVGDDIDAARPAHQPGPRHRHLHARRRHRPRDGAGACAARPGRRWSTWTLRRRHRRHRRRRAAGSPSATATSAPTSTGPRACAEGAALSRGDRRDHRGAGAWASRLLPVTDDPLRTAACTTADGAASSASRSTSCASSHVGDGRARCASTAPRPPGPPPACSTAIERGRGGRRRPVQPHRVDRSGARRARRPRGASRRARDRRRRGLARSSAAPRSKGPADRLLRELGHEAIGRRRSPAGTRRSAATLVIDDVDADARRPRSRPRACGAWWPRPIMSGPADGRRPGRGRCLDARSRRVSRLEVFGVDGHRARSTGRRPGRD